MLKRVCMGLTVALAGVMPAQGTDAPVIVIPGKAGVPVIVNGYDASYTVVEGDWGLDRPGHMPATIVSGPLVVPDRRTSEHYFPAFGYRPGYGRREVEPPPNRKLPPPAPTYERFWGAESAPLPPTIEPSGAHAEINVDVLAGDRRRPRPRRDRRDRKDRRDDWR
jgi:hypothetical protein